MEVWMISPDTQTVAVYQLRNGQLESIALITNGDLKPVRFPGVSIPVAALWPAPR